MRNIHLSINGYLIKIGHRGCGKCLGFCQDEKIIANGESFMQLRCISCSEIAYPGWTPLQKPYRRIKVPGHRVIANCPDDELYSLPYYALGERYDCNGKQVYYERERRGKSVEQAENPKMDMG